MKHPLTLAICLALLTPSLYAAPQPLAFPGAEGFGAHARGGRGGKVLFVSNLDDFRPGETPVPGSLRAAVMAKGPRTIIFRVSGTIELKAGLRIEEPFVTIAGQTAPGDGLCLKNHGVGLKAHNVVMRYLRLRPGDEVGRELAKQGKAFETDALCVMTPAHDVIVDHCSASWANDEVLSVSGEGITNVTVQWCLIGESLNKSTHKKGAHGYGSLLRTNGNVTFHHNLYAHHRSRCPRPGTYGEGSLLLDFRNNVVYNGAGYSAADPVRMNYVGNFIKRPRGAAFSIGGESTKMYVAGNVQEGKDEGGDNWSLIRGAKDVNRQAEPFAVAAVATDAAPTAYAKVLRSCGALLPTRDAVDTRVLASVKSGEGDLIDSQEQVGGWPQLKPSAAPADTDEDGMPDDWEKAHGLNPQESADGNQDEDGDGYTNIEEWLNGTDPASHD